MTLAIILGLCASWLPLPGLSARPAEPAAVMQAQPDQNPPEGAQEQPAQPSPEPKPEPKKEVEVTPQAPTQEGPKPEPEIKPDQAPAEPSVPEAAPPAEQSLPPAAGQETPSPQAKTTETKPSVGKKSASKKRTRRKKKPANQDSTPSRVVVPNGSTPEPSVQLAPTVPKQQASNQLQNTTHLLDNTEANLRKISVRQLSVSQQETIRQIRKYMEQAKTAANAGDVQRANNLAVKAQLLSQELLKQ